MIKAVFFDIDDTVYNFRDTHKQGMENIAKYMFETVAVPKEALFEAIDKAQDKIGNRLGFNSPAFHNRQIRYQNALDFLKLPIYPYANEMYRVYWNTVIDNAVLEPGLMELLKKLKFKGIYLGIGSDMTSYIQNKKLEKLDIAVLFNGVVTSEEAGIDKPGKEFFELCVEKSGVKPEECLFIGDNLEKDVLGPKKINMNSACYRRYSEVKDTDGIIMIDSYQDCIEGNNIKIGDIIL